MKFWEERSGGINLINGEDGRNYILTIKKKDGKIRFRENCDQYFSVTLSPEDAKVALREAIDYIDSST